VVSVRGRNSASLKQLPRQNRTILGGAKTLGAKVLGMVYNADRVPWRSPPVATYLRKDGMPATLIAASAKTWATWGAEPTIPSARPRRRQARTESTIRIAQKLMT
jgi:hypothetical protein